MHVHSCRNANLEVQNHYSVHVVFHTVLAGAYIRHYREVSVLNKYSVAPNSGKERELQLCLPPFSLQEMHVLKSSMGRKKEHYPDPNRKVSPKAQTLTLLSK